MIEGGYEYGEIFQRKLLALLVRHPDRAKGRIKALYFTSPIQVDIARVVQETYSKHPKDRLTRTTLCELVKASLGRKARENWSLYKKEIKSLYRVRLPDKSLLMEKATEFERDSTYREAVVDAEKFVNAKKYDKVHEIIEKAKILTNDSLEGQRWKWHKLPRPRDFRNKEIQWLVEGLIPEASAVAISGEEGVGKTLFALSLARALAEGRDFLERKVWITPVLYLGLDVSQVTLQSYLRMMRWIPSEEFRILTMWTGEDMAPPMLDDAVAMERLYELARNYHPVIIFDTLRDFFEGEENSSTETKPVVDAIRKLRSLGATVIVLVHPPKTGKSLIRGTGNISQKVDIPYLLEKDKWHGKEIVVLTCPKKNRFGSTSFQLPMRMNFIPMPSGPLFWLREIAGWNPSQQRKGNGADEDVIQFVLDHPGTNQKGIESALKTGDRKVRSALYAGRERGVLKRLKGDRKEVHWYPAEYDEGIKSAKNEGFASDGEITEAVLHRMA